MDPTTPCRSPSRRTAALALALLLPALPLAAAETTLPPDDTATVDLRQRQAEAEREAALKRAEAVAAARGQTGRVASIPEVDLVAREALGDLAAVPARIDGAEAAWRVRSRTPPELFAHRIVARLMKAGFKTWPPCAGEAWSGKHGDSRVAVRTESRGVAVLLFPTSAPCPRPAAR